MSDAGVDLPLQWSTQIDELLASWCDNAKCFEYMHAQSCYINSTRAKRLTILITITTALTGTTNIITGGASWNGFQAAWIFGGLSVLTSMATMLADKLGYAQAAEAHKRFCSTWGQIRRKIESELILPYGSRKECSSFLKMIRADIDQVSADGNTRISQQIREEAYEKFKSIPQFDIPDICGQLEHTKVFIASDLTQPLLGSAGGNITVETRMPVSVPSSA
jgi:hypothetical protein